MLLLDIVFFSLCSNSVTQIMCCEVIVVVVIAFTL